MQEIANVSSDVIRSLYDTRRRIEYISQWPEVNCTVQDAVAVVSPASDEGVHHGLSSCLRQCIAFVQSSTVAGDRDSYQTHGVHVVQTSVHCQAPLPDTWLQWKYVDSCLRLSKLTNWF